MRNGIVYFSTVIDLPECQLIDLKNILIFCEDHSKENYKKLPSWILKKDNNGKKSYGEIIDYIDSMDALNLKISMSTIENHLHIENGLIHFQDRSISQATSFNMKGFVNIFQLILKQYSIAKPFVFMGVFKENNITNSMSYYVSIEENTACPPRYSYF